MTEPNPDQPPEKRKHPRVSLIQDIECEGDKGVFHKRLTDISVGGMFIDGLTSYAAGDVIMVKFRLPEDPDPIEVCAKVIYVQEKVGSGVQFLDLTTQEIDRIQDFVDRFSAKKRPPTTEFGVSSRVLVSIPITLRGSDKEDEPFVEETSIVTLAKNGASIRTNRYVEPGKTVFIQLPNGQSHRARIIWVGAEEVGVQCRGLAHELGFDFP